MFKIKLFIIAFVFSLVGCGEADHADLRQYIADQKRKPSGVIDPIPAFTPYEAFSYGAITLRSPFDIPIEEKELLVIEAQENVKPDLNREKEYLEGFPVAVMKFRGTLTKGGVLWALVDDGSGGIHPVTQGNYIGKNHGRIVSATNEQIDLIEIVSNGRQGWIERPRTIKLSEKE